MILVLFDETQGESDVNKDNTLDNFQANVKISSYKKESSHRLSWDSHFEDIVLKYLIIKERDFFSISYAWLLFWHIEGPREYRISFCS